MAKTGFLVVIYQDVNPSSPTYNTTREERTQSEEFCPTSAEANWIEDTKYCELTENGMLTGYEITVYRDVEQLSSTYNQTKEEKELNLEECEADETAPNWQNIGDPFCRQKVYLPGGLMGNDGYMIQQQQDMNEYSETADEIREIETLDLTNCPLPNTLPEWEVIYEACHIVKQDGQLMFDGTKDVVRIDRNQYSPSWNNNVPETVNIEDLVNCPPDIEVQYRWVVVSGEYMCVGYDKHSVEKKQRSTDGETWVDVMPLQTRAGALIEANSEDCGYQPTIEYRWVVVDEQYICVDFDKHALEKKQQSSDGGTTWTDVTPTETRAGALIEANSEDCGYQPTIEYRWVVITGQYECVGYDKYAVEKKQQSSDGGQNWTDVIPSQTRTGSLIERNSTDCGYLEPQYRWVAISDTFVCVGYDKHQQEKQQVSYDNGTTWEDVVPANTRTGSLIEHNSDDCGYVPETVYRWVTISDEYMCVGFDKHTMEKKQQSVDGGTTWTDVVPTETRAGELIEENSEDCGYTDFTTFDCGIIFTDLNTNDHHFSTNSGARFELLSTQVNNANGLIRVNFRIHIKKDMSSYAWVVRADGGTMAANKYIGNVVKGQVITDYFEVPCGSYNFMLMIQETISDTTLQYAQSRLTYICNDCSETPVYTTRWVIDSVDYLCNGVDKYTLEREQYYQNDEWWYTSKEREGVLIESNSLDCGGTGNVYESQYLRTTALEDGTITFFVPDLLKTWYLFSDVYYSTDNGVTWNTSGVLDSEGNETTTLNVTAGQSVLWKCTADRMGLNDGRHQGCQFGGTASFNVDGNIMSMIYGDNFIGSTIGNRTYVFTKMFMNSKVVDASNLIMLKSVTTNGCYSYMFYGCRDLTVPPELPARALSEKCYEYMFYGCTGLRMPPVLPAETLVEDCYDHMLTNCSNIIYIKALFTTTPGTDYTNYWVQNVAESGTFVKNENATWDVVGYHGIPVGWVIQYSDGVPPIPMQYRWITDTETYECIGYDKYSVQKRQQSVDGGSTWTDVVPTETRTGSLIEANSEDCGFIPYMNKYLTVESLADNNDIIYTRTDGAYDLARTIYVSTDNGAIWTSKSSGYSTPTVLATLNTGDKLLIKGTNTAYGNVSKGNVISSTDRIIIYGNIMSLRYGDNFIGETAMASDAFVKMFSGNPYLISAENLVLPATTMATYCYYGMFWNCTSLTTPPELPATTLAANCYNSMFDGCISLETAPELPATTLVDSCYNYMFNGCTSLNYIYAMFTTTPSTTYTNNWVQNVAASGTFVKSNYAEWDVTGVHGIPTSWTVQYGGEPRYRWTTVTGQYECVGYDKYALEKKQQSTDGGQTWTDVVPLETQTGSLIERNSEDCGYIPPTPTGYETQYLTIESLEDGNIIRFGGTNGLQKTIQVSTDGGTTWVSKSSPNQYSTVTLATLNTGDKLLIKGTNTAYSNGSKSNKIKGDKRFIIYGNIMSLISGDDFVDNKTLTANNAFKELFKEGSYSNGSLVSAENLVLPATTLTNSCYSYMFSECIGLTAAPVLPATTLTNGCYSHMFSGCTSLTTAPQLPALTLANWCCWGMFDGCTNLVNIPSILPATTLAENCYANMFNKCSNITTAPELPAETAVKQCYYQMFYRCSKLNYIKCLAKNVPQEGEYSTEDYTSSWTDGVASSGTFVKNRYASWKSGTSGIPTSWTVQDAQ